MDLSQAAAGNVANINNQYYNTGRMGQSSQPSYSQHSKVTSLIRRKASDLDEDDPLEYSESSATHYFQLEGTIQQHQQSILNKSILEQQQRLHGTNNFTGAQQEEELLDPLDMNFINSINNECNSLLTKFNQNQNPKANLRAENSRRNSNTDAKIGSKFVNTRNDQDPRQVNEDNVEMKVLVKDNSVKTVNLGQSRHMNKHSTAKSQRPFQNQLRAKDHEVLSQEQTLLKNLNAPSSISNPSHTGSLVRGTMRKDNGFQTHEEGENDIQTYEIRSPIGVEQFQQHNRWSDRNIQNLRIVDKRPAGASEDIQSSALAEVERKLYEDGSHGYINSSSANNEGGKLSKHTISENGSISIQLINSKIQQQQEYKAQDAVQDPDMLVFSQDKITFRQRQQSDPNLQNMQPPVVGQTSNQLNEDDFLPLQPSQDNAQFDLQNFNAFENNMIIEPSEGEFSRADEERQESLRSKTTSKGNVKQAKEEEEQRSKQSNHQENERQKLPEDDNEKDDREEKDDDSENQEEQDQNEDEEEEEYGDEEEEDDEEQEPDEEQIRLQQERDEEAQRQREQQPLREHPFDHIKPYNTALMSKDQQRQESIKNSPNQSFNDEQIFNRLPKNFFVQDEEAKDLDIVMSSIKKMRQDFLGYMNESNISEQLEELQNIIQPERFIQKHLGEDGESLIFEKVISPQKDKDIKKRSSVINQSKHQSTNKASSGDDEEPEMSYVGINISSTSGGLMEAAQRKGNVDEIEERLRKVNESIKEEDQESSPEKTNRKVKQSQQRHLEEYSPPQQQQHSQNPNNHSSKQTVGQNSDSKQVSKRSSERQSYSNFNPKQLKMADYFKNPNGQSPKSGYDGNSSVYGGTAGLASNDDNEVSLSTEQKEGLIQKMEQEILGNIDINFLFCKGGNLRQGLIDQQKTYKLMKKIKEIAQEQVEKGSKEIDYSQIVKFLREEELYAAMKIGDDSPISSQMNGNSEPLKSRLPDPIQDPDEQWVQVVDFMRKNPKLLLQMLPDNSDEEKDKGSDKRNGDMQMMQQVEDNKKWTKLQALSKQFLTTKNKKNFMEAIDQLQFNSSPRNLIKERKSIQIKSISKNHRKISNAKKFQQLQDKDQQSDSDYQMKKAGALVKSNDQNGSQSRQIQYYKQFQYSSTNNAKNVYSNAPCLESDTEINDKQAFTAQKLSEQINSNRGAIQSQQVSRQQQKGGANTKKSTYSMGDNSTIGTSNTGNITQLNNYNMINKNRNILETQHQTVCNEYDSQAMHNLANSNQNPLTSQRRPITASAAFSHKNKSLMHMQPILQARQEQNNNDIKDSLSQIFPQNKRGSRLTTHGNQNPSNDKVMNDFANVTHYFSQGGTALENYTSNKSDINTAPVNQSFNMNMIPSRKTQNFIEKIAPNLKENELYPKFINNRVRRNTQSRDSSNLQIPLVHQRAPNNDAVSSFQNNVFQFKQRKAFADSKAESLQKLNQSASNISQLGKDLDSNYYEQTPQGQFLKFVKRQGTSQSTSTRKDSFVYRPLKNQSMNQKLQVRIGGQNNRLLVSPNSGSLATRQQAFNESFKQDNDNMSQTSKQESEITNQKFSSKHVSTPIIDWAFTPLFQKTLAEDTEFNKENDLSIYVEKEVDYVIDMMKNKYKDFKRSDLMRPFFLKAQQTLQTIFVEQNLSNYYDKLFSKYKEITIENTMKLLIRAKLAFHQRNMMIEILKTLIVYELNAVEMKSIIDKFDNYRITKEEYERIRRAGEKVFEQGHQLLVQIKTLRSVHKQNKSPFIFKKKDYVSYVKNEMNEIKKLMSIFKIKTPEDEIIEQQQKQKELNDELKKIEEHRNETEEQMSTNRLMSQKAAQQVIIQQAKSAKLKTAITELPWNFSAHLLKKEVQNLEAPMKLQKYLPLQYYTSLFKDYTEALQSNDFDTLHQIVEPSFSKRLGPVLENAHQEIQRQGYEFRIENQRKHHDETQFFLFNIENYFLVGMDNNRLKIDPNSADKYNISPDQDFDFTTPALSQNGKDIEYEDRSINVTQIVKTEELSDSSEGLLLMRLHFLVHTYLNLYIWDPQTQTEVHGHRLPIRNLANKKSHLVTIDKLVAKMHIGDAMLETQDQIEDKVIMQYKRDEGIWISDFDNFMLGNPIIRL